MRVALVNAALDGGPRGNRTTLERWRRHVRGAELVPVPASAPAPPDPLPDLVHGYHAYHGGRAALDLARRTGRPLVVSLGGTDLLQLATSGAQAGEVARVLDAARLILGPFKELAGLLAPGWAAKYAVVPRGVELPTSFPEPAPRAAGRLRILLPAGLRPVKRPLLALELAEDLIDRGLDLELTLLGRELDRNHAAEVRARAASLPWVRLDRCAREKMAAAYAAADVVWNTSRFEGCANALLEAAAAGCALFAARVPGNRELLLEPGAPGTLFDPADRDGIEAYHRARLAEPPEVRRARWTAARSWLERRHAPALEARALEEAYRRALSGT